MARVKSSAERSIIPPSVSVILFNVSKLQLPSKVTIESLPNLIVLLNKALLKVATPDTSSVPPTVAFSLISRFL